MKIQSPLLHLTLYALHLTPYTITFIKIVASFTSLIPCLVLPRELRETTEGTPKEDHMTKKALFLRLSPKKVDWIPKKVDSFPKIASSFGDSLCGSARKKTSYSNKKCTFLSKKCIFLEMLTSFSSLLYYLCSGFQKKAQKTMFNP